MTVFVDTNVSVYARDAGQPHKQSAARTWIDHLWDCGDGRLSTQVLNEFYVTGTRKLSPGMARSDARADIRDLSSWQPLAIDSGVIERAFEIEDLYGFSYWDALIVASAATLGCRHLLTEDLQDGQEFNGLVVVDPFRHPPDEVLIG